MVDFHPPNISSNYTASTDMSESSGRLLLCSDLHLTKSNSNDMQNAKKRKKRRKKNPPSPPPEIWLALDAGFGGSRKSWAFVGISLSR
jgi:hypothetical protein